MSSEEESPTPAEDPASTPDDAAEQDQESPADALGHSGSRWEPEVAPGTTWWHRDAPAATARPRRRALRVAAGIGAALVLAGGGFAAGHAVGDSGPDGGPAGATGGHHRFHDDDAGVPRRPGQSQPGQSQPGQVEPGRSSSAGTSAILGGLFT